MNNSELHMHIHFPFIIQKNPKRKTFLNTENVNLTKTFNFPPEKIEKTSYNFIFLNNKEKSFFFVKCKQLTLEIQLQI